MTATDPREARALALALSRARAAQRRLLAQQAGRRQFLRAAGLGGLTLGGAAALAACGGSSDAGGGSSGSSGSTKQDLGDIAVQLSWIKNVEFAGEYMADSKGYYTDAGFSTVDLMAGGAAGTAAESAVASGRAFCGLSAPTLTAPAILAGAPLMTVGATFQKNPFCITSPADAPITQPQDMVGKRIGVQSGGNDTIFGALLKANDIDPASITKVPVQFDPSVLTTGQIDGFMSYITNEPITLAEKGFANATLLFADHGFPLTAETFVVAADSVGSDRDKLKAFLLAEVKGWTDAVNDPAAATKLAVEDYGKELKLDAAAEQKGMEAQNALIITDDVKANGLFTMTPQLVEENITSLGLGGITIDAKKLFDTSLIDEVHQENPDLKGMLTA